MKIPQINRRWIIAAAVTLIVLILLFRGGNNEEISVITDEAAHRNFSVEVRSVGELEASRSNAITSPIKGDQAKIISLIADGTFVQAGDSLIKMDPTPYEENITKLLATIREQECKVSALEKALECERCQNEQDIRSIEFEVRTATLELEKILKGDGPQETARLKSSMQKAKSKYEELNSYSSELEILEKDGFLNTSELVQARKKLEEEKEAYEIAKIEFETYHTYVYPMQVEKAQISLIRAQNKLVETKHTGTIKLARDAALWELAKQELADSKHNLEYAKYVLEQTDIKAPAPGIVVLKEEYRNGQRRKARVGDVLIRNQVIIDLPDLDSMIVKTKIRESDLYKIEVGKPATIVVDAYPQMNLYGKVLSIGVLALADTSKMGDEKYFDVLVGIDTGDPRLRPGMTARIVVMAGNIENKLTIPIHAVFEKEGRQYCYVEKGNKYLARPVKLGLGNEHWVHVVSGVDKNEKVCLTMPPKSFIVETE